MSSCHRCYESRNVLSIPDATYTYDSSSGDWYADGVFVVDQATVAALKSASNSNPSAAGWRRVLCCCSGAGQSSAPECEVKYALVPEGSSVTLPAGARQLTVTTPCDGSASCTGLSTATTTVVEDDTVVVAPATVSTATSNISQPYEATLKIPVTITAETGQTEVSWLICS